MTSPLPLSIGTLHLVGIGGIGMSGIAEVLHAHGYDVRGSDIAENANVRRLRALGVEVALEQRAENVEGASFVVVSSAIKPDNPEVKAARAARIPLVRRAEMLAELMRLKWSIAVAGTHGKTTTTSLVAALLDAGGHDPTVINGGIINAYGTNARVGAGEWMVVEADESDGAFLRLPATIGIITNIDPEHLDFWGDFDALRQGFGRFVENLPFYGFAALCIDDPEVQALIPNVPERRILTYGFSPQADLRGIDLQEGREGTRFAIRLSERLPGGAREIRDLHLPMVGRHNTQNALAALLVALEVGVGEDELRAGLARFTGVGRRFTTVGEVDGIRIIDDYGHHPTEIAAVLQAARSAAGADRVIAVVQPHRYTRLRDLFQAFCTCFNDADDVLVAPVYAAGETPIEGCDHVALAAGLQARGHRHAEAITGEADLAPRIAALAGPGDVVICLGAGSITSWAAALPAALDQARAALKPASGAA